MLRHDIVPCYRFANDMARKYGISPDEVWNLLYDYLDKEKGTGDTMTSDEWFYMSKIVKGVYE